MAGIIRMEKYHFFAAGIFQTNSEPLQYNDAASQVNNGASEGLSANPIEVMNQLKQLSTGAALPAVAF
jgi:hypothetical protein